MRPGLGDRLLGAAALVLLGSSLGLAAHGLRQRQLPLLVRYLPAAPRGVRYLTLLQAKQAFDSDRAAFVDARDPEAYRRAHVLGAVSMPAWEPSLGRQDLRALGRADPVIIYCDGPRCGAARKLAQRLARRGLHRLCILTQGWPGWRAAGYPAQGSARR